MWIGVLLGVFCWLLGAFDILFADFSPIMIRGYAIGFFAGFIPATLLIFFISKKRFIESQEAQQKHWSYKYVLMGPSIGVAIATLFPTRTSNFFEQMPIGLQNGTMPAIGSFLVSMALATHLKYFSSANANK